MPRSRRRPSRCNHQALCSLRPGPLPQVLAPRAHARPAVLLLELLFHQSRAPADSMGTWAPSGSL
eukprot:7501979-Alexandrium_andersonii.AAC.1